MTTRTLPNSAFFTKMQGDNIEMAELIDLETRGFNYHWTSANREILFTLSGAPTIYEPLPGEAGSDIEESADMGVAQIGFSIANTGDLLSKLLTTDDVSLAKIKIGRVFTDTPDLGRIETFQGKLADYSYDRRNWTGNVRNTWGSLSQRWPYYNYQDNCAWTFGSSGCGFDTTSITLSVAVASIVTGSTTTIAIRFVDSVLSNSWDNGRFDFGRLSVTNGVNSGNLRTIRAHTGDLLFLSHPLPVNSFASFDVDIFPGCRKRLIQDCTSLYDNDENFLGFSWIPIQMDAF